jgi:hypothetical protein
MSQSPEYNADRLITLGPDCAAIPERLMLAHARGQVLFITGAGISQAAELPDFRQLVLDTYEVLDAATHEVLLKVPRSASNQYEVDWSGLTPPQRAEVQRFIQNDYDVVLGLLERRLDPVGDLATSVRRTVDRILREGAPAPASLHRSLMTLADRGGTTTIVTTNFDLLLEATHRGVGRRPQTYALGAIPRPSRRPDFAGVFHIHGALDPDPRRLADFIISDHDFGEFYLRRRAIPDFIYDAARLFHIVLVGYSANDPPMRYLLNAVAADGSRFEDLKERFTFVGGVNPPEPRIVEDWKGRGITPIPYSEADYHVALARTLARWAELSPINGRQKLVDAEIRRIVRHDRANAGEAARDLFDHLIRRSNPNERVRLAALASRAKAGLDWLQAIDVIAGERP